MPGSASYCVLISTVSFLAAGSAIARPVNELGDIVVTAQKRAQSEQDIPISMGVLDTEDLSKRNITNISNLSNTVPNLRVAPFGVNPTTLRIFIRGLGPVDSQITQDPPVGIYINGVYVARPVALSTDIPGIERIEVLRGPQGTLYGRNTTGGAINIITKKPDADWSFSQLLGYGNYNAIQSETLINIPLSDRFFISGGFSLNRREAGRLVEKYGDWSGFLIPQ